MRCICHDCGMEIPDDMDFCPQCGCLRSKATQVDDSGFPVRVCPRCGAAASPRDAFCGSCGESLDSVRPDPVMIRPRMRRNGALAFMLAVVPGFFNIFGIGHLLMRDWAKGIMFLCMSAVLWYICGWTFSSSNLMITLVSILVFFYQLNDISRLIFSPEAK